MEGENTEVADAGKLREAALAEDWTTAASLASRVWKEYLKRDPKCVSPEEAFCTFFTVAWAQCESGDFDAAHDTCAELLMGFVQPHFEKPGLVVGNELFHLLVAKIYLGNGHSERSICDELIRACSSGGVEFLTNEPPALKRLLEVHLRPPSPFKSWDDSASSERPNPVWRSNPWNKVQDAFVVELLCAKLGPRA